VAYVRARGIRTVLVLRHPSGSWWPEPERDANGTPLPDVFTKPIDGLGVTREELPDAVIYRL
jgi:hypothetical protein